MHISLPGGACRACPCRFGGTEQEWNAITVNEGSSPLMQAEKVFVSAPPATEKKGDVNGNGKIDSTDYAMCKRAFLKTYTLSAEQLLRADINSNGKVDAQEYAMIKRHFLKTYTIPGAEGK